MRRVAGVAGRIATSGVLSPLSLLSLLSICCVAVRLRTPPAPAIVTSWGLRLSVETRTRCAPQYVQPPSMWACLHTPSHTVEGDLCRGNLAHPLGFAVCGWIWGFFVEKKRLAPLHSRGARPLRPSWAAQDHTRPTQRCCFVGPAAPSTPRLVDPPEHRY